MENSTKNLLPPAARTSTTACSDQINYQSSGAHIVIDVTVAPTSGSITPKLQGICNNSYYDILEGLAISSTGISILKIYPGISPIANVSANDSLPISWRLIMTHSTADSFTYSASVNLLA